jgi:hypothetical protein
MTDHPPRPKPDIAKMLVELENLGSLMARGQLTQPRKVGPRIVDIAEALRACAQKAQPTRAAASRPTTDYPAACGPGGMEPSPQQGQDPRLKERPDWIKPDGDADRLWRAINGYDIDNFDKRANQFIEQHCGAGDFVSGEKVSIKAALAQNFAQLAVLLRSQEEIAESEGAIDHCDRSDCMWPTCGCSQERGASK